ncbi:putative disease resistance protein RGA3 [Lycium barbarum]|uniref:putative disease resistance protein RGA3 n=1 Tax=Lycium barbarum TaxID=112863 RepID=UPI00293F3A11|nr:putative disease resistance protein RGA3 [Lycium barbarum]
MFLEIRKPVKKLDKIGRYRNAAMMIGRGGFMHTRASVRYTGIVGRDSDRDIVVEMLLKSGNEDTLFVFPIVGVGGIGKTTLAKLVYNDPRIVREDLCENLGMNELQKLVRETLYEKNYLVVLDDVWNEYPVKWNELKKLLIVGSCGSKILVTTRNEAVASLMGTVPAYCLKEVRGKSLILNDCRIFIAYGTDEWKWDDVEDHDMWNSNQDDKIAPALSVSYERLPSNPKVCLAYCSIFPKGCAIEIDKLIQLWVAEGLITAQVEFCTVNSHIQNISDEVRHVAFSDYDLSGKKLPASLVSNQALRTISFSVNGVGPMSTMFVENCIARFMQLKVLDISDSCFDELPSSVGELKYLRYLDVSANGSIKELPDSINELLSLQTLRVSHCARLEGLPKDIGNLISLRHLHITTKQAFLPDKAIGCLSSLRSLFIYSCNNLVSLSEGLQHLTSLRTLAIIGCPRLTFFPSAMKHLTALENLLIVDCEELTLLEWQDIEGLRMVRSLVIGGLPELESKDVHCLGSLQMLVLAGLPQLVTLP